VKLHWSPRSPYVRKVLIAAHEAGLADRIECVRSVAMTTKPNPEIMRDNPLSKIPTLVLEDGSALYDSPVICEYLDGLHDGPHLFPASRAARFTALRRQALGDGLLDLLILWRGERLRLTERQLPALHDALRVKCDAVLTALDGEATALGTDPFAIGHVAIGCALSYLDFRFADLDWRKGRPGLAAWHAEFEERPSVRATPIVDDA
jgi:glutathione S-transferase